MKITIYANGFTLLVQFTADHLKLSSADLMIYNFESELIIAFLDRAENARKNSPRPRNAQIAAIQQALFRYIEYRGPVYLRADS